MLTFFSKYFKKLLPRARILLLGGLFAFGNGYCLENYWPVYTREPSMDLDYISDQQNVLGPILESKESFCEQDCLLRPIGGQVKKYNNCSLERIDDYFLYPFFSRKQTCNDDRWNMLNLVRSKKSYHDGCLERKDFLLFPLFSRSVDYSRCEVRSSMFPVYGKVDNFFGVDSVRWAMFPFYLGVERQGVVRHHLLWPFIKWQKSECAGGGGLWPLYMHFWRENKYDHRYFLWPICYNYWDDLDKETPRIRRGLLPLFAYECSAKKEVKQFLWPFFSHIQYFEEDYVEDQFLWPLFVQGRGPNKRINRWAPFYSYSCNDGMEKYWFLWPILKIKSWEEKNVYIRQEQVLYFFCWRQRQWFCACGEQRCAEKMHFWPFYSFWHDGFGHKQIQFLSPLEVFFPLNEGVRKIYSPLFALFKAEQIGPDHSRQSLLFSLIQAEKSPCYQRFAIGPVLELEVNRESDSRKVELLKGLLGYESNCGKKTFKFLWMKI